MLQEIIGQNLALHQLDQYRLNNRVPQSLLFTGPENVGKSTLATRFVQELLAENAPDVSVVQRLVLEQKHPDLFWIKPDADAASSTLKVEQVRMLTQALALKPVQSNYRVAVIEQADGMTDGAGNALLKTLEEPNPSSVLIVLANSPESVLPTLVSRCQQVRLSTVALGNIEQTLVVRGVSYDHAQLLASLSHGKIGWALRAAEQPDILQTKQQQADVLLELLQASYTHRLLLCEKLAKEENRTSAQVLLQAWWLVLNDLAKLTVDRAGLLAHADRVEQLLACASKLSLASVQNALSLCLQAQTQLFQKANLRLVLESFALRLPMLVG